MREIELSALTLTSVDMFRPLKLFSSCPVRVRTRLKVNFFQLMVVSFLSLGHKAEKMDWREGRFEGSWIQGFSFGHLAVVSGPRWS